MVDYGYGFLYLNGELLGSLLTNPVECELRTVKSPLTNAVGGTSYNNNFREIELTFKAESPGSLRIGQVIIGTFRLARNGIELTLRQKSAIVEYTDGDSARISIKMKE